jgi:hypothetical protein
MFFNLKLKIKSSEKGVSLIITFFIMIIVLAVVLSLSSLLYSEIKLIRNISYSISAFYAADSGTEKVLFYDRQVIPEAGDRGFCAICENCPSGTGDNADFCYNCQTEALDAGYGCNPDICNNCKVSFKTSFGGKSYEVIGTVSLDNDKKFSELEIKSKGIFNNVARQFEVRSKKRGPQDIIKIENACVDPKSVQSGSPIEISANVSSNILNVVISKVKAVIRDYAGDFKEYHMFQSDPDDDSLWFVEVYEELPGVYYVDIVAEDSTGDDENPGNKKIETNIPSCY